jgi:hypothetical protein
MDEFFKQDFCARLGRRRFIGNGATHEVVYIECVL